MNRFLHSLIISILIHAVVIAAAYFALSSVKINKYPDKIILPLYIEHQQQNSEFNPSNHGKLKKLQPARKSATRTKEDVSLIRKPEFYNTLISPSKSISTHIKHLNEPEKTNIKKLPNFSYSQQSHYVNPADEISKDIMKYNNNGTASGVSVSGLISSLASILKQKNNKVQFDFIPTQNQIIALKILFNKKEASQIDLYKSLDFRSPVTAKLFDKELSQLVDKGFLKRKKVSPQLIFNMFGVPIEMSSKNIKNPIYKYETCISRPQIITFLQSQLFLLEEKLAKSQKDIAVIKEKIAIIKKELQILIR